MMRLEDKVALITGSSRGIGRAVALRFAEEGAKVIVNYAQHASEGASLVDEIRALGRDAIAVAGDVRSEGQVKRMVEMAAGAFGRIDIWMNNAGADIFSASELTDDEKLQRVLDVDVKGTFLCCRAIAPIMEAQGSGCIINVSWDYALTEGLAGVNTSMLAAAKGAVHSLSMCLARELAPNVRVNVVAPGWVNTSWLAQQPADVLTAMKRETPMGRIAEPADVAEAALYLAAEAGYITGQTLVIDGGRIMY